MAAAEGTSHVECRAETDRTEPPRRAVMTWYQVTLSAIADAVLTTDPEGRVIYMNPAAERLTGWVGGEAYGQPLEEVFRIVNEKTRKAVAQPVREVIETGLVYGMANDTMLIAKDGTERPIDDSTAPVRDEAGNVIGVVMVFRDISELRRRERAVQDARAYADSIIDTVRDPLIVLDANLRVRSASRSFYQAFGVTPEVTEGRLVYELGNGQWNIPRLRTLLEEILPQENSFRDFEVDHVFERIGQRRMLLNARKVWTPENHSELILLAIEDITQPGERGRIRRQPRALSRHRRRGHELRHLHVRYAGDGDELERGAETMLGYSEAEMLGQDFRVIFTPEDIETG